MMERLRAEQTLATAALEGGPGDYSFHLTIERDDGSTKEFPLNVKVPPDESPEAELLRAIAQEFLDRQRQSFIGDYLAIVNHRLHSSTEYCDALSRMVERLRVGPPRYARVGKPRGRVRPMLPTFRNFLIIAGKTYPKEEPRVRLQRLLDDLLPAAVLLAIASLHDMQRFRDGLSGPYYKPRVVVDPDRPLAFVPANEWTPSREAQIIKLLRARTRKFLTEEAQSRFEMSGDASRGEEDSDGDAEKILDEAVSRDFMSNYAVFATQSLEERAERAEEAAKYAELFSALLDDATPTEREVLRLTEKLTPAEIAAELGVSRATIDVHNSNIRQKAHRLRHS
jgi:DNA-binding CsgD family transcriptional regulator